MYDYTICIVNNSYSHLELIDIEYLHHYVITLGHHSPLCKPSCNGKAKTDCQSYSIPFMVSCTHGMDTRLLESIQPSLLHLLESLLGDPDSVDNKKLDGLTVSSVFDEHLRLASRWYRLSSRLQLLGAIYLLVSSRSMSSKRAHPSANPRAVRSRPFGNVSQALNSPSSHLVLRCYNRHEDPWQ
jgi:hypothetical protein